LTAWLCRYVGSVITLCIDRRAVPISNEPLGEKTVILKFEMPIAETITGFFDKLKVREMDLR
jgi:translation elongation factor EF-4